jgi:hypothetical protein
MGYLRNKDTTLSLGSIRCSTYNRGNVYLMKPHKRHLDLWIEIITLPFELNFYVKDGDDLSLSLIQIHITVNICDFSHGSYDAILFRFDTGKLLLEVSFRPIQAVLVDPNNG